MPELTVVLRDLPPRALSPNGSHGSHHAVTLARREYREYVAMSALAVLRNNIGRFPVSPAEVAVRALFTTKRPGDGLYRPRDVPNLVAALKPLYDGLVDASVLVDDKAEHMFLGPHRIARQNIQPAMEELRVVVYGPAAAQ